MQGRASNKALLSREMESRFKDHINDLHKKAFSGFIDLMDEVYPLPPFFPFILVHHFALLPKKTIFYNDIDDWSYHRQSTPPCRHVSSSLVEYQSGAYSD